MAPWTQSHPYSKLEQAEQGRPDGNASSSWHRLRIHAFYITLLLLTTILPNLPSLNSQTQYHGDEPARSTLHLPLHPTTLQLNLSYAMPPSDSVNQAWSSLIPSQGGFFTHPEIAPQESCFAVFHQIHCLDAIRMTLYEARADFAGRDSGEGDAAEGHGHGHDMYHIGHCFDLLRQSLMCKPDLTVEVANKTLGGVTGFGTEHRCVDWRGLMDWMRDHE